MTAADEAINAIDLLIRADGLLGLSRYRGLNGDDPQWTRDADNLISDIRALLSAGGGRVQQGRSIGRTWEAIARKLDTDARDMWIGTRSGEAASRMLAAAAQLLRSAAETMDKS